MIKTARRAIYVGPSSTRSSSVGEAFLGYGMTGHYLQDDLGKHFFITDGTNISHAVRKSHVYLTEA